MSRIMGTPLRRAGALRLALAAPLLALILAAAPACAKPPHDPELQRLSAQLAQLDTDPELGPLGGVDRLKAHQALAALAQTAPHSSERKPALYIAERRVQAAQFAAQADLAQKQIDQLDREHDRILLDASRRDADRARMENERLRMQDKARQEEAQRSADAQQAQQQQQASLAADESDQAQALAQARAKAAALAQQEAALTGGKAGATPAAGGARGPSVLVSGAAFAAGSGSVRKDRAAQAQVQAVVDFVRAHPDAAIRIEGHTDTSGGPQKNLALSRQRAEAIKNYLRAAGIAPTRIQVVGLGAEQPVASNATAAGRARNNRVEVIALGGGN
ncbi:MAG: OmpA family protein [Proteobacteria bacterium]|nr:OmpA family protein [Pseudomonadota bacterium]